MTKPVENDTVCVRSAAWIVAWSDELRSHIFLRDQDFAFSGDRIVQVGGTYDEPGAREIDGRGVMVVPGLINIHSHPDVETTYRGIREDHGVPEMYMTGLYDRVQAYGFDEQSQLASAEVAYCEMLLSGCTTVVDLSSPYPGWSELAARSGLRTYLGPHFASARWKVPNSHTVEYEWDLPRGEAGLAYALEMIDQFASHPSGRLSGILYPAQIDTCDETLLRDAAAEADRRDIPITTHISQSVVEFHEMVRRHGITPVQWADKIGLLGPRSILGHAIFIDDHSKITWWTRRDLSLLAESGTSVAHCPTTFSRYGQMLEDFGRYQAAGVTIGIGTDCVPHNMIEELRCGLILGRIRTSDINAVSSRDILEAGTINGAKALGRDDIGRLATGKKADFALVDLAAPLMQPLRDPWRSLLFSAADRAIRDVFIDGRQVVKDRQVLTLDHLDALDRTFAGQVRMENSVSAKDRESRTSLQISPLSLPIQ
ncbi:amidohydrolase family protein [Nitratireductor sp. StC3]|uniref:amidohydrolase family protein n=1 Tax=Nitratireductor sp. StC3 TaxID=2126741 RepID=UPI000D0DE860|nr:amidohydrolase family protein [Nitratireductor sp. StC3]PSM15777.1 N-ethylammeline chlorohydrolase [Nitratireductor sp. StC3]